MDLTPDKGLGPVEASAERAKPKGDSMGSQTVASTVSEDRHLEVNRGGESLGHEKHDGDKTPRRVWWISGAIVPITRIQCFNSIFSFIRGGHIIGITTSPIGVLISGSTGVSTNLDLITRLALHFKVNCSCFCGISFLRAACSGTDNGDASSASTAAGTACTGAGDAGTTAGNVGTSTGDAGDAGGDADTEGAVLVVLLATMALFMALNSS
jgi:hypothetical protein